MTQVCYEGTYFSAQYILDPANNSPWAWHTVTAMLAIWDDPKSWAHLATLPFPKPEGFGRRPKDMLDACDLISILWHTPVQVGHVPHFPPTMSVRIFGYFEQFSTFSARRAPCSAPSCTRDAWTNGPYMTWVLWTLVTMVGTPRGRSGATFVKVLAQSECGQFCHFGNCGPNLDCHHADWHEDL